MFDYDESDGRMDDTVVSLTCVSHELLESSKFVTIRPSLVSGLLLSLVFVCSGEVVAFLFVFLRWWRRRKKERAQMSQIVIRWDKWDSGWCVGQFTLLGRLLLASSASSLLLTLSLIFSLFYLSLADRHKWKLKSVLRFIICGFGLQKREKKNDEATDHRIKMRDEKQNFFLLFASWSLLCFSLLALKRFQVVILASKWIR